MPPSEQVKHDLVPGLRAHPACHAYLAYHGSVPICFSIRFLGYFRHSQRDRCSTSTTSSSIFQFAAAASARCCSSGFLGQCARSRIAAGSRSDLRRTIARRGLYRKVGFDWVVVGANRIALEYCIKPPRVRSPRSSPAGESFNRLKQRLCLDWFAQNWSASIGLTISPTAESTTTGMSLSFSSPELRLRITHPSILGIIRSNSIRSGKSPSLSVWNATRPQQRAKRDNPRSSGFRRRPHRGRDRPPRREFLERRRRAGP